jgi:hypothetical protein
MSMIGMIAGLVPFQATIAAVLQSRVAIDIAAIVSEANLEWHHIVKPKL